MSEKMKALGECGIVLFGKLWKQGASLRCPKAEIGLTRYPRPKYGILGLVRDLCAGCEFISGSEQKRERGEVEV